MGSSPLKRFCSESKYFCVRVPSLIIAYCRKEDIYRVTGIDTARLAHRHSTDRGAPLCHIEAKARTTSCPWSHDTE